jgi:hypothetical protein
VGGDGVLVAVQGMYEAIPLAFRAGLGLGTGGFLRRTKGFANLKDSEEAVSTVLGRIGWPGVSLLNQVILGGDRRRHYPLTVKSATNMQLGEALSAQREARNAYVGSALSASPGAAGPPGDSRPKLSGTLRRVSGIFGGYHGITCIRSLCGAYQSTGCGMLGATSSAPHIPAPVASMACQAPPPPVTTLSRGASTTSGTAQWRRR